MIPGITQTRTEKSHAAHSLQSKVRSCSIPCKESRFRKISIPSYRNMGTVKTVIKERCDSQGNGDFVRSSVSRGSSDPSRYDSVIAGCRTIMPKIKCAADSKKIVYTEIRRNQGILLRFRMNKLQKNNEALTPVTR